MKLSDWLDPMCRVWGAQKRSVLSPIRPSGHLDGWPESTLLARIKDEKYGAGHFSGRVSQHFPEVYLGDGLKIHRAIQRMPESPRAVMEVHYVVLHLSTRGKAEVLGISRSEYFRELESGYRFLAGNIPTELAQNCQFRLVPVPSA